MAKYYPFINISRFFAILLVVFGHTSTFDPIVNAVYSFHVPLFFILSGILFTPNKSFIEFTKKKFYRLIIPYFIIYVITLLFYILFESRYRDTYVNPQILRLLPLITGSNQLGLMGHNVPLWFLPSLFTCEVICNFIVIIFNNKIKSFIAILEITIIGYILSTLQVWYLPWGFSQAIVMILFYYTGFLIKPYLKYLKRNNIFIISLILSIILFYLLVIDIERYDVAKGIFPEFYKYIIISTLGAFLIIALSVLINKNSVIEKIGMGDITLFILGFHGIFSRILLTIVKWGGVDGRSNPLVTITICIINVISCYLLYILYKKIKNKFIKGKIHVYRKYL